jgi:hypothetical protein
MAQEYRPGEIVPQSGIYTITHDPAHADMPHEVTVIKGRRFPTCTVRMPPASGGDANYGTVLRASTS